MKHAARMTGCCVAATLLVWAWPALAAGPSDAVHLPPRTNGAPAIHTWRNAPHAVPGRFADPVQAIPAYELHAIHTAGAHTACLDLVFVADGFTALEKEAFWAAAAADSEALLSFGPYAASQGLINTHALFVASAQSGADHPSTGHYVDTAFNTTFDYNGFERLAVADNTKVLQAVGAAMPDFDLAVVLVNDPQYGGSGGPVPVASLDADSVSILRHELAHNIADLADEYTSPYPGYPAGDPEPNVASAQHLDPLKWQAWITMGTAIPTDDAAATGPQLPIGAYEGARYQDKGMFRPAPMCLMRSLDQPFCPVCAQAVTLGIAARTETLRSRLPASDCVVCKPGACPAFSVTTADVPTLQVRWSWNGSQVATGTTFLPGDKIAGDGTLTADVRDLTTLVRSDPDSLLVESVSWTIHVGCAAACGAGCDADVAVVEDDAGGATDADPPLAPPKRKPSCMAARTATADGRDAAALAGLVLLALAAVATFKRST